MRVYQHQLTEEGAGAPFDGVHHHAVQFSSVHHTIDLLSLDNTDYVDDGKGDEQYCDHRLLLGLTDGFSSWRDGQWHGAGDSFTQPGEG
jgi:hypothetical protein